MSTGLVTVCFLDKSSKTLSIDDETTCEQLAELVCDQIELAQAQEDFRFFLIDSEKETILGDDAIPLELMERRDSTTAASPDAPKLVFKRAFFMNPEEEEYADPVLARLMFHQAKAYITSGMWPVTVEQAVDLGGILMACTYGEPTEEHTPGFLLPIIHNFVPQRLLSKPKPKVWEARILEAFKANSGMTREEAERRYLAYARENCFGFGTLPYMGAFVRIGPKKAKGQICLMVSHEGLHVLNAKDMSVMSFFPYSRLRGWTGEGEALTINVADPENEDDDQGIPYLFSTRYAPQIETILNSYVSRIVIAVEEEFEEPSGPAPGPVPAPPEGEAEESQ